MNTDDNKRALLSLEASILGAILVDNSVLAQFPTLEVVDFFDLRHRAVFAAVRNLESANQPMDPVTVEVELAKSGKLDAIGGPGFLGELALHVPTTENAIEYVRQIRNASLGRRIRLVVSELLEQDPNDGAELLSMAWSALSKLDEDQPDATRSISDLVRKRFKQLEQIAQERESGVRTMTGFPTGVAGLDEKLGGWQPGIVSIVAARPGMGKSSLGLATARAASEAGFGVHVFSLEDTEDAYADRSLSGESDVPAENLRNAALNRGQMSDLTKAFVNLRGRRWVIDDRSGITADEIVRSVRRHKRTNQTRVVIVDYVQLVARPRGSRLSRHEELTEIVTTLANAAKHDGMAYVVMSQLNRELEKRSDKRPQLADLRESGSLEERAKCVVGMYRGSIYGSPVRGVDWDPTWGGDLSFEPTRDAFTRTAQLCVLKNSNGRTGLVFANWDGSLTKVW
jgi:replicative DNA helicase